MGRRRRLHGGGRGPGRGGVFAFCCLGRPPCPGWTGGPAGGGGTGGGIWPWDSSWGGARAGGGAWDGRVWCALCGPLVGGGQGGGVEGDHAFGGELAERDAQPGPGRAVADDAADFQVEELTDAQARAAQDGQADAGEGVVQAG